MAKGALCAESTSEQIHAGLERATKEGKELGRPHTLTTDPVNECKRIYAETASLRQLARIMRVSHGR